MGEPERTRISLNQQLGEARTLLEEHSYILERTIAKGLLGEREAGYRKDRLRAIIRTLEWLQRHESTVRGIVGPIAGTQP